MKLTDTQALILNTAIQSSGGQLSWFPDNFKGGARNKVLGSLLRQELIQIDDESHRVTDPAYEALGLILSSSKDGHGQRVYGIGYAD